MAVTGCSLDKQTTPPLSGPSELGLALGVTATPDVITQDGQSQATIRVEAHDASSQPVSGLVLRAETRVDGTPVDIGILSTKSLSTGTDGRATLVYRAPASPSPSQTSDIVVEVAIIPVGNNYTGANIKSALIRLARPGVILPPNGTPTPRFFFSPTTPKADEDVFFDGSASTDSDGNIATYLWNFGDGDTELSSSPTARHSYDLAGTYNVTLTVTDDRGLSASTSPAELQVSANSNPTAAFVVSPASPKVNTVVNFNASASRPAAGRTITQYIWDFGDGTPVVTTGNPVVNHTFGATGGYVVTLKVVDDTNRFAVVSSAVSIAP
jgi:PKD repeat protein